MRSPASAWLWWSAEAGQIALGQAAMVALGAYAQAVLVGHGLPALLALPLAAAVGALGGALASLPARRLGGLYFGMSTLAFALIAEEALVRWESLTHGAAGMAVGAFTVAGWRADSSLAQALVSAAALGLALFACARLCASRHGRAWRAVRDDEVAAAACGIDPDRVRMQAFVVGGALSGLAGGLYAHWIGFISPEQFGLAFSFELLMLAFIGGARRLGGGGVGGAGHRRHPAGDRPAARCAARRLGARGRTRVAAVRRGDRCRGAAAPGRPGWRRGPASAASRGLIIALQQTIVTLS